MRAIETFNGLGTTVATMTSSTTNSFLQNVNAMRASARAFTKARTNTCVAMPRSSPTGIANRVFNAPNVGRGYPAASAGFGGLGLVGDHLLCPEVDDVVIAVKSAVAQALRAKPVTARASALVGEANAFVNRYSGKTVMQYPTIGSLRKFRDQQRQGERDGTPACAAGGKRGPLHHDMEDGLMKCHACCDMPE